MRHSTRFPIVVKRPGVEVKIYRARNRGGWLYQVTDYSAGKRRLRSFMDLAAAQTEAELLATRMANGEMEALKLTSGDRAAYVRALDHLKPTGVPLEVATSVYARAVELLGGDHVLEAARYYAKRNPAKLPQKSVSQIVAECLEAKKNSGASDRYLQDLRYRLGRLAEAFHCNLSQLTGDKLQDWLDAEKLGAQSRVNFRRVLNLLFEFAKRRGYLPKDWDELERLEKVKVKKGEHLEIFTPEKIARLLRAAAPDFLPALAIGAFCGLRTAELERIDWSEVRLVNRHVEVTAGNAKTASRRLVPVPDNLAAWLAPYAHCTGKVWTGGKTTICDAQQETAQAAGVRWKRNGIRHSWTSYRLAIVKNAAQVALEAGNSAGIVFQHYRELVTEAEAQKWFGILPPQPAENVVLLPAAKTATS